MATVVLTGFMGTGKTSIGRRLAARLGQRFVDTDVLVERDEGCSIAEIFATRGEPDFRATEQRAIAEAVTISGAVIATGGGAIMNPDNLACLQAAAPLICLTARPQVLLDRIRTAGATRPLLEGAASPEQRIVALLTERAAAYAKVDLTVDTSDQTIDQAVDQIAAFLRSARPERPGVR